MPLKFSGPAAVAAALLVPVAAWAQQPPLHSVGPDASAPEWTLAGPQPETAPSGPFAGRIPTLAQDPADATGATLLYGTAGGGVWRLTGAMGATGSSTPLTDAVSAFGDGSAPPSLAVGAVSPQPGNTGVLLAGTGEPGYTAAAHYGEGILRSIDSGQTWNVIPGTVIGTGGRQVFAGEAFSGFAWSGALPDTVVAAISGAGDGVRTGAVQLGDSVRGLYVSTDRGTTWNLATIEDIAADGSVQLIESSETNFADYDGNSAVAVVWNGQRQQFFAAVSGHGLYSSSDGATFTRLAGQPVSLAQCPTDPGFAPDSRCPFVYAALTVQPASGDMFVWYADASGTDQGLDADRCGLSQGDCAGNAAFTTKLSVGGGDEGQSSGLAMLAVHAGSGTQLLLGAAQLYGCTLGEADTTCSLTDLSASGCASGVAGQFRSLLANTAGQVFAGTAEGLWRAPDAACATGNFTNLNAAVGAIAPAVSVAGATQNVAELLAGLSDLGAAGTASMVTSWPQLTAGDSGTVALDEAGGDWYAQDGAGVSIARCTGGESCANGPFTDVIGPAQVDGDAALEHAPFLLDPATPGDVLIGTCRVWRGPASGQGWSSSNAISPVFDGSGTGPCTSTNALVSALAAGGAARNGVSPVLYAGMSGFETGSGPGAQAVAGHLFATTSAASDAPQWTDIALSPVVNPGLANAAFNPAQYDVSAVVADSHDPTGATVYATIRGFGEPHVYRSTNAGASWTNVSANLPDEPANAIAVDPNDASTIYAALDSGVYVTQDIANCAAQDCWQAYGINLPTAQAYALQADGGATGQLRVALQGRGVWQAPLASGSVTTETSASVTPASLTFPGTPVSTSSAPQTLTITNTGELPLTITAITAAGDFTVNGTNCTPGQIAIATSCTVSVVFAPSATGTRTGTLTFSANVPGGQAGPIPLTGTGLTAPQIELSPSGTLSFGILTLGSSSAPEYILIENTGQTAAPLDSFAVTGDFAIPAGQNSCGTTLAAQTGCAVGIVFTPTARGTRTGSFTVTDVSGVQTVILTGAGQTPASVSLSPATLTFTATLIDAGSPTQSVTVTNSGDQPVNLLGALATGDFSAASGCGTVLTGNSSCIVAVTFYPTQEGARTGLLNVMTPFQTLTAALSGTGVGIPKLTLNPESLNFGSANLGQSVGPLTATLTNTGTAAVSILEISTATLTAGTNDYAVTSNCASLAVGATCTLSVAFTPSVSGPDPGTLTIEGNAAGTVVTAALNGSGNELSFTAGPIPTATVPAGQTATYALAISDDGYAGPVTFSCTGLPAGAACVPPSGITLPGSGQFSATLKVSTGTAARGSYTFTVTMAGANASSSETAQLVLE